MVGLPKIEQQTAQYKHVGLEDFCLPFLDDTNFHWHRTNMWLGSQAHTPEEIDALAAKGILFFLLTCTNQRQKLREIAIHTLPQTNIAPYSTWKWLVWRRLSFWDGLFSGANVSLRECYILAPKKNALLSRNSGGFLVENIITQNDESVPYSAKVVGRDFFGGREEVASMNIKWPFETSKEVSNGAAKPISRFSHHLPSAKLR